MALPIDVREMIHSGTRLTEERERPVRLMLLVEADAPDGLIDATEDALRPATDFAALRIKLIEPDAEAVVYPGADAVIMLAGTASAGLGGALVAARGLGVPVAVVGIGDDEYATSLGRILMHPTHDIVVRESAAEALAGLGLWLAEMLPEKRLALAHNYAFMRRAVAEEAIRMTAAQNGIIGAAAFFPGADMPIMTANQGKMLLQIAAAYGQPLGVERMRELVGVIGGGFVLRGVARQALAFVPFAGWAVKGGIGYAGTVAMGKAALTYFEEGGDLTAVRRRYAKRLSARRAALPAAEAVSTPEGGARA